MTKGQNTINQRIGILIEHFEAGNKSAFGRRTDMKSGVVGDLVGGRLNKPSFDAIQKILSAYPLVNTDWLIKGEGEMLRVNNPTEDISVEYFVDILNRPHIKDKIEPLTNDKIAERPDPELDWRQRLQGRLHAIGRDYALDDSAQFERELIKEVYEIITPEILKGAAIGARTHWFVLEWYFPLPSPSAWTIIREIPIGLYPSYPFLQYFLDFADPYRRIAVFVEEEENSWNLQEIDYQDKLLIIYGWKVFRIPYTISKMYEADLLPHDLIDVYDLGPQSKEQLLERQGWDLELSKKSIDGFFRWLKKTYFQKETLTSIAFREQDPSEWDEQ